MKRRDFVKTTVAALIVTVAGMSAQGKDAIPPSKPNIILLFIDDLGYGDTGPFGCTDIPTPHIDSLAKNGVICTSFYATTPVCSPSRAALISGRYPHKTPVNTNNIPLDDRNEIKDDIT